MKRSLGPTNAGFATPTLVVGTYDESGKANMAAVAWGGVCCSKPPCLSIALRKATYTHGCIVGRRAFCVCIPSQTHVREADYFGMASGRDRDKVALAKLTPVRATTVDAPYVEEFPVAFECKLVHTAELGLHTLFVGEVVDVKADESVLDERGRVDLAKAAPFLFSPPDGSYFALGAKIAQAFSAGKAIA